jgi:hypothetical protein
LTFFEYGTIFATKNNTFKMIDWELITLETESVLQAVAQSNYNPTAVQQILKVLQLFGNIALPIQIQKPILTMNCQSLSKWDMNSD